MIAYHSRAERSVKLAAQSSEAFPAGEIEVQGRNGNQPVFNGVQIGALGR
jgi:hypothetical protein